MKADHLFRDPVPKHINQVQNTLCSAFCVRINVFKFWYFICGWTVIYFLISLELNNEFFFVSLWLHSLNDCVNRLQLWSAFPWDLCYIQSKCQINSCGYTFHHHFSNSLWYGCMKYHELTLQIRRWAAPSLTQMIEQDHMENLWCFHVNLEIIRKF